MSLQFAARNLARVRQQPEPDLLSRDLVVVVDNRLRLPGNSPPEFVRRLREATSHPNPDYAKKRAMGLWVGDTPTKLMTWRLDEAGNFSLPRGVASLVRQVARDQDIRIRWADRRLNVPVAWDAFRGQPRPYQETGIGACVGAEQGIVRAPTGCLSGETMIEVSRAGWQFAMPLKDLVRLTSAELCNPDGAGQIVTSRVQTASWWDPRITTFIRSRSADEDGGSLCWTPLVDSYASGFKHTHAVRTASGHKLRATVDHLFLTADDGWVALAALDVGMFVYVALDGQCTPVISRVEEISNGHLEDTFDLALESPHNYLANGIVVHNSGKTLMALAVLPRLGQRSLVVVRDRNLLEQWLERAERDLGLRTIDVGLVQGGKRRIGERLTVALQQTLYSKSFPLAEFAKQFGALVVDEVHEAAARTVMETVDAFPARARLGFSADHKRRDRKEVLTEDLFGDVIFEVGKAALEDQGHIVPVIVRLVPTEYQADWYSNAPVEERDFVRLVTEMSLDAERGLLIRRVVLELVASGAVPVLVFTHRREHASRLAESELPADGVPTGLLLGSEGNAAQFEESKALLLAGVLKVAVGTFKAVGQGIDLPNVRAGVCATPIGANKQFFGQVRGRICRVIPGKTVGHLYYLWDRWVFPDAARNLLNWNDGLVEVFDRAKSEWVPFTERRGTQ